MVLCAYVDMLNLENHMKGHQFFCQAAEIAVEVNETNRTKKKEIVWFYYLDLYSPL